MIRSTAITLLLAAVVAAGSIIGIAVVLADELGGTADTPQEAEVWDTVAAPARAVYPELGDADPGDLHSYATATCHALADDDWTTDDVHAWLAGKPARNLHVITDPGVFARVFVLISQTAVCPENGTP